MMRYTLHSIERSGPARARVLLLDASGDLVEAIFTIDHSPIGDLATPEPDVFLNCGGSAEEVRAVTAAVIAFCAATPWRPLPE